MITPLHGRFVRRLGLLALGALGFAWVVPPSAISAEVTATDYFNLGSATFIRENPEPALAIVNEGLLFYPDDEPLLKLKALLEQQQDQQQQQQRQSDAPEESDPSDPPEDAEPADPDDSSDPPDQEPSDTDEPPAEPPPDSAEAEPQANEMTEEEAEMILDSLRQLEQAQREQLMQEMIRRQMRDMPPVEKDW